jgi:hypothetical protein
LQIPQSRQPHLVEKAMGRQVMALLAMLDAACAGADDLQQADTSRPRRLLSVPDSVVMSELVYANLLRILSGRTVQIE